MCLFKQALLMEIDLPAQLLIALMVLLAPIVLPQIGQKVLALTGLIEQAILPLNSFRSE